MSHSVQVLNSGKTDCIIFKPSLLNGCILIVRKISSDGKSLVMAITQLHLAVCSFNLISVIAKKYFLIFNLHLLCCILVISKLILVCIIFKICPVQGDFWIKGLTGISVGANHT